MVAGFVSAASLSIPIEVSLPSQHPAGSPFALSPLFLSF